jgi:hypothetical protein
MVQSSRFNIERRIASGEKLTCNDRRKIATSRYVGPPKKHKRVIASKAKQSWVIRLPPPG